MEKKKEQMLGFLKMLKDVLEDVKENGHNFDINSDECKKCASFAVCKEFNGIRQALESCDYDNKVKLDLLNFVAFIKYEYLWLESFDVVETLKDDEFTIYEIHQRFDSIANNFKNWDKLVELLDDNQLSLIRKIILDVNHKIIDFLARVKDDNLKEMNKIVAKLRKTKEEEKSYENMTREELIKELKKK